MSVSSDIDGLCRPWHLLSFPRSGNHLVRALLEASGARKTLGCPGAKNDKPIYLRAPNKERKVIRVNGKLPPIALKSHFSTDVWRHEQKYAPGGIIFIIRNPVDAISSHLLRGVGDEKETMSMLAKMSEPLFRQYLSAIYAYKSFPKNRRVHLKFEDVVQGGEPAARIISDIGEKMGAEFRRLEPPEIAEIMKISMASQKHRNSYSIATEKLVRLAVSTRLSYPKILRALES